jgi:hypothetical protein
VHAPRVCCTWQLHQHRRVGSQHVVQVAAAWSVQSCARQVMVAMRKTHHKPTVPRVQPLLKCAPSRSVGADGRRASDHLTERSLQVDGSQHDRITELVIHPQQPELQQLLPVAALASTEPNEGGAAGLTQL